MGRSPCCSMVGLHRGPWTAKEDALLVKYIQEHGEGQWRSLPKKAGLLRCGKSCRLRWMNYLRPDIKRGNITSDEDDLIIRMHALLGNRWSLIAGRLPGRTDNEIKNYWNTHLSKKLRSQGIDPNTHKKLPVNAFLQAPKKKRNRRRTTRAGRGNNKHKNNFQINVELAEKTKIHNPKPVRLKSTSPLSVKTKNSTDPEQPTAGESSSHGGDRTPDMDIIGAPWSKANIGDNGLSIFIHGNHSYHDHLANGSNIEFQAHVPPLNNSALDKIYEEYLQLLKTEDNHKAKVESLYLYLLDGN